MGNLYNDHGVCWAKVMKPRERISSKLKHDVRFVKKHQKHTDLSSYLLRSSRADWLIDQFRGKSQQCIVVMFVYFPRVTLERMA